MEEDQYQTSITSMTLLTAALKCVSQNALVKYFKKVGIRSESQVQSQFGDDDSFIMLDQQLQDFQDTC